MPTSQEKLQASSPVPLKRRETDHENLRLSRDQFEAKYRKKDEIDAKLSLERARLEEESKKEVAALEKAGSEDIKTEKED